MMKTFISYGFTAASSALFLLMSLAPIGCNKETSSGDASPKAWGSGGGNATPTSEKGSVASLPTAVSADAQKNARNELVVGFLPVTCHLTCPVTSWITAHNDKGTFFRSKKYTDFATVAEEFQSGKLNASFILAPLAMSLRRSGLKIKIVHLGHRDGTAIVIPKDSTAKTIADLKGKKIAIPHNFSNQRILLNREMEKFGLTETDFILKTYAPPEMPSALQKGGIDAYVVAEPVVAKAEIEGFGKVMAFTKDIWPNFISCVLAVREDFIKSDRATVQELVNGIAASGKWLDDSGDDLAAGVAKATDDVKDPDQTAVMPKDWNTDHRMQAAAIVSRKEYYNQDPKLLKFVLSKTADRVRYTNLVPLKKEFEEIQHYAEKLNYFPASTPESPFGFDDYCDPSFAVAAPANQKK
ncbi:MAG: ABC transporter substrate-binding protein [Planctomycetes bacterium]|nr:ABC transporter substrate-binding protein [Planctomycetota bacterium]